MPRLESGYRTEDKKMMKSKEKGGINKAFLALE
jgi:hypothetical protein